MTSRIDRTSASYKRELLIVTIVVTFLTITGGLWLGAKISSAEQAKASGEMQRVNKEKRGKVPGPEHGFYRN